MTSPDAPLPPDSAPSRPAPSRPLPPDVAGVLALLRRDPGRPRLTWYGPGGERVELSGHVLDNWVAKTANLLVEELDAGPGTTVAVDLPVHWRTVVWSLAAWRVGAGVTTDAAARTGGDVVVTADPAAHPDAAEVVAVALPALARRFDGDLPPGAIDAAGAVMTYGDVIGWAPEPDPSLPALGTGGTGGTDAHDVVRHADLVRWAADAPGAVAAGTAARALLAPDAQAAVGGVLREVLGMLACDGSVVLCAPEVGAELAADPSRRERLVSTERVTAG